MDNRPEARLSERIWGALEIIDLGEGCFTCIGADTYELEIICADFEQRLASQIAANDALRAQLQEKWIRINELERNNKLMAEQLIGNSQQPYPLLHS